MGLGVAEDIHSIPCLSQSWGIDRVVPPATDSQKCIRTPRSCSDTRLQTHDAHQKCTRMTSKSILKTPVVTPITGCKRHQPGPISSKLKNIDIQGFHDVNNHDMKPLLMWVKGDFWPCAYRTAPRQPTHSPLRTTVERAMTHSEHVFARKKMHRHTSITHKITASHGYDHTCTRYARGSHNLMSCITHIKRHLARTKTIGTQHSIVFAQRCTMMSRVIYKLSQHETLPIFHTCTCPNERSSTRIKAFNPVFIEN